MIAGLMAWWRGLRHLNHRGYIYIWANVLWLLLSLPVVTAPAAWAGLIRMSHTAYTRPTADIHDFWAGFRENLRRGLVMAVLNIIIVGINVVNLLAYSTQPGVPAALLRWTWLLVLFIWFTLQLYMWPILCEMRQPTLRGALRNAAVMMVLNPFFTIGLWIGVALIVIFSSVFIISWALLTGSALAAVATGAVIDRLEAAGHQVRPDGLEEG